MLGIEEMGDKKSVNQTFLISAAYKSHCEKLDKLGGGEGNENVWSSQEQSREECEQFDGEEL